MCRPAVAASTLVLAVALAGAALPVLAGTGAHTQIDAKAFLAADGSFHVVETYDVRLEGGFDTFDWEVGLAADQTLKLERVVRVDTDSTEHVLQAADAATPGPDQYFLGRSFVHIGLDEPGAQVLQRRYRFEYHIDGAVAPAWDIPSGAGPQDPLEVDFRKPWKRLSEAIASWREAWPEMKTRYRLDHDLIYPFRGSPLFSLGDSAQSTERREQLEYKLDWDPAWKLLGTYDEAGVDTPDVDFRAQRTFARLAPGVPAAVDFRPPTLRLGAIAGVPVLGLVLWLLYVAVKAVLWRLGPQADAAFFEERVATQPPERIAALMGQEVRLELPNVLRRLAAEKKVAIEVLEPATDDRAGKTRLRLLASRDALHSMDRDVVDAVFPDGDTTTTSDAVRQRYANKDEDVFDRVAGVLPAHVPAERRRGSLFTWAAGAVFFVGLWYAVHETTGLGRSPFLVMAGVLGGLVASASPPVLRSRAPWPGGVFLLVTLGIASVYVVTAHFVPNTPIGPNGAIGLSLMVLGGYAAALARTFLRGPREEILETLWRSRTWAAAQLRRSRPALKDAWISRLEALGLGPAVKRWRESIAGSAAGEETDYTAMVTGPPFTGNARPLPNPGAGWSDGFYPDEA
jgi:hypothetical protein